MKPNLVSCDDAALEAMLLHDELAEPSEELLAHVESCHHCQQRISEIAGPIAFWQDVKDAISDTVSSDPQRSFTTIKMDPSEIHWTESMANQLLAPPSHPEMLGRLGRYEVERLIGSGGMESSLKRTIQNSTSFRKVSELDTFYAMLLTLCYLLTIRSTTYSCPFMVMFI